MAALIESDSEISVEQAISEVATDFEVSELAMTHRLTDLRLISPDNAAR